ncbi:hypothetical protein DV515_00016918, partial [Chloebia gouldiae]
ILGRPSPHLQLHADDFWRSSVTFGQNFWDCWQAERPSGGDGRALAPIPRVLVHFYPQRKSSKAKEKKQRRLEERAAMAAVCAKVEAANKLTKANMQTLYEQSEWGWKEREKREELRDERAWYLLAREPGHGPVAFSHFRFDVECGDEVLYCYEVQLESRVRRRGLGKFLLQILQLVANSTQMKKVMLTVFKHNHGALQFFREALHDRAPRAGGAGAQTEVGARDPPRDPKFEVDATSPSVSGCCGDDSSYEILSRSTRFGDPHPGGGPCAGCCH